MRKTILVLIVLLTTYPIFAHYIWIETKHTGKLNEEHQIKVRFGEYTYGVIEKVEGDAFKKASNFTLWVITPNGDKIQLQALPKKDFYAASFIPTEKGTYTVVLDNKEMKVLDFTQYDYGIFKPQYHAKAKISIGHEVLALKKTNRESIEIIDLTSEKFSKAKEVTLQVLFKGGPLKENELTVFVADLWLKKLTTDKEGKVSFKLPWPTKYIVEVTFNEKVPGNFKGLDYEFIWHCATYCILLEEE